MATILFLVDTTASMNQKAYTSFGRLTFLDLAKRAIDMFMESRQKIAESRYDRYMLITFDEPPHNRKVGWNESFEIFQKELSLLEAFSFGSIGLNIKHALDALNIEIIANELETSYGNVKYPRLQIADIILITEGRKISSPSTILKELPLTISPLTLHVNPTQEGNRWDHRFYAIVLRIPGVPVEEDPVFLPHDECDIDDLCKASGGRSFCIKNLKILMRSVECLNIYIQKNGRHLENDGLTASANKPVLSIMEKKAQTEMYLTNFKKRLDEKTQQQTIVVNSCVNRETAIPSYLVDKIEFKFIDFINFNVGVEGKSAPNKQLSMDIFDTPRQKLLDRLIYLRSNFFQYHGKESIDENIKHNILISDMMNFNRYIAKIPPALRPVTPKQFHYKTRTLIKKNPNRGPIPKFCTYKKGLPLLRKPVVASWRSTKWTSTSSSNIKRTKPFSMTSSLIIPPPSHAGRKRTKEEAELFSQFENWWKNVIVPKRFKISVEENNIASPGPSSQVDHHQVEVCTITSINTENTALIQTNVEQPYNFSAEEENTVQNGPFSHVSHPDSEVSFSPESALNSNASIQEEPLDLTNSSAEEESTVQHESSIQVPPVQEEPLDLTTNQRR